jgi:hypothetical protein
MPTSRAAHNNLFLKDGLARIMEVQHTRSQEKEVRSGRYHK